VVIPSLVTKLIIADIAPRSYPPEHHIPTLDSLLGLDLSSLSSRKEADDLLSSSVSHWGFRQFLLTNLFRKGRGLDGKQIFKYYETRLRNSLRIPSSQRIDMIDPHYLFEVGSLAIYAPSTIPEAKHIFPIPNLKFFPMRGMMFMWRTDRAFLPRFKIFCLALKSVI